MIDDVEIAFLLRYLDIVSFYVRFYLLSLTSKAWRTILNNSKHSLGPPNIKSSMKSFKLTKNSKNFEITSKQTKAYNIIVHIRFITESYRLTN